MSTPLPALYHNGCSLYNVHMKRVTATEARKNWFRLLDEVAAGEAVVVERKGHLLVLRRENARPETQPAVPDYRKLLRVPAAEEADHWSWEWPGQERELRPVKRKKR